MNDSTLRQDIIDELDFDPSIDAAHIGVAVEDGIVTLTGHLCTYAEKALVEDVVRRIKGVRGIAQEIEIRPSGTHKTADDEIARRALDMINWNTRIPDGAIQVKVQNGWVTLSGKVAWQYQKAVAEDAIKSLSGVLGIANDIEVHAPASESDVRKLIMDALKRSAEIEAKAINVNVVDGTVTLKGSVKAWSERNAAVRAAWSAPGVKSVEDRLTVI